MNEELSAQSNSSKALETLRKVLTEIGWEPQSEEKVAGLFVDFGPPHIPVSDAFAAIAPDTEQFVFYVNFGPAAPSESRDELARLFTRVNWGLMIGNFEMDYEDGHVRFKSSVDFRGVELSEALIRNAIRAAMNAVDAYAEAVIDVMARGKDAQQAIEEVHAMQRAKNLM